MELVLEIFIQALKEHGIRNSWTEFNELKNADQNFYSSNYYDAELNKYKVKTGTPLRSWENKDWINEIYP